MGGDKTGKPASATEVLLSTLEETQRLAETLTGMKTQLMNLGWSEHMAEVVVSGMVPGMFGGTR